MKKLLILILVAMTFAGLSAVLLNESFTGTTFPPADWSSPATAWGRYTTYFNTTPAAAKAGYSTGTWWLVTPKLKPVAGANTLTFWYRDYSADAGWDYVDEYTYVMVSTTTNFTGATTLWTGTYTTFTTTWQQATIDMSAYNNQEVFVAFKSVHTGGNYRIIDDVTGVDLAPAGVPNPAVISSPANAGTGIAQTATLNWTSGGGAPTGYKLQYGTNAAADNIMALTDVSTVTTYDPAGLLTYGQTYYWKVVPYNAAGDATGCPTWSFTVMADPTQPVPYTQDFESGSTLAVLNWSGTMYNSSGHGNPGYGITYNLYSSAPTCNAVSNPIGPIPAGSQLEFDYRLMNWSSYPTGGAATITTDVIAVQVSADGGATWDPAIITIDSSNHVVSTSFANKLVTLPAYEGDTIMVRFVGTWGSGDYYVDIDNFKIRETPAGAPDAVTLNAPANGATGQYKTGFNLGWSPAATGGTADYYAVYMSMDEGNIYSDVYFETTGTSLNPTTYAGGPSAAISFNYGERWYWTVEAVNGTGSAVVEPPYWFEIEADPTITIPHTQSFDALVIPTGWTQSYSGGVASNRWAISATNSAGGTVNEMMETWVSGVGITRLITPPINTTGFTNFALNFNTYYNDYGVGVTAKVQYSHDLVTWYDTSWSAVGGAGDVGPGTFSVLITGLVAQPVTYIAWALDGDHFQFDYWHVDNVVLTNPANHDVQPISWDVAKQVVPEGTVVVPMATVGNNGINTETFTVSCVIGTYNESVSVTGLASGATQQVTFPALTPALWSAENVFITTNLATDEVVANDELTDVLVCLDLDTPALANNAQTDQFVQFNLADPTTLIPATTTYTGTYFMSGGDWMNGKWMTVEYDDGTLATDNYYEVDPLTGVYAPTLGEPGAALMGIAYDDDNDILYGVGGTNGMLYTMNSANGLATSVAVMWYNLDGTPTNLPDLSGLMIGAAYDNLGNILYGVDLGNDCLWTINPTTAELTLVGFFGIDLNYAQDCAFDQENGLLFLAAYSTFGGLYWVDTTTGAAYLVGPLGTGYECDAFAIPYGLIDIPVVAIAATGAISWDPVPGDVHYQIYKATDPYGTYLPYATAYSTTWTDPTFVPGMAFYKVAAVGGTRSVHQNVQFAQPNVKSGKIGEQRRFNIGVAK